MAIQPHRSKYWLHPKIDDYAVFEQQIDEINTLYKQAAELREQGINVVSVDEKPGMQANERVGEALQIKPGKTECVEFEYIRHGTQCLTANLVVATGKIIAPTIAETRKEEDFVRHIEQTVATDPTKGWIFILDNLNTHISASLVEWVADILGLDIFLGKRKYKGILKDQKSRKAFLTDSSHRIRFVYTPKHCSWLNQIEIWFSKLSKQLLTRTSFKSKMQLKDLILRYIEFHNQEAKPYQWKCDTKRTVDKIKIAMNSLGI